MISKRLFQIFAVLALIASVLVFLPSGVGAAPIPDDGLPPVVAGNATSLVSTRSEVKNWGVYGNLSVGDSHSQIDSSVLAFAEIGNTVYVGGKFSHVQRFSPLQYTSQSYLAAFNRDTGEWIPSFRPVLDGTVWDLAVTPNGQLMVAGQFTNINGAAGTSALAVIDPTTAAVDTSFRASLGQTSASKRPFAMTIKIVGDQAYIGGNFNRLTNLTGGARSMARIGRIDATTGNLDGAWRPHVNGEIFDIEVYGGSVYIAGNITTINYTLRDGSGRVSVATGDLQSGQHTTYTSANYQQTVIAYGGDIWMGGSQHILQSLTPSFGLQEYFVNAPWGDFQALTAANGYVYGGSHAYRNLYTHSFDWRNGSGATSSTPVLFLSAFNASTKKAMNWVPSIHQANEGIWALMTDSQGCIWAGGDFTRSTNRDWYFGPAGAFARFCGDSDVAPPTPPTSPTAEVRNGGVQLNWGPASDANSPITYQVFRNDDAVSIVSGIENRDFFDAAGTPTDRYFIRATDPSGNISASTAVINPTGGPQPAPWTPNRPTSTQVADDNSIQIDWVQPPGGEPAVAWDLYQNGTILRRVTSTSEVVTDLTENRNYYFQVRSVNATGQTSQTTGSVLVDKRNPSVPTGLTAVLNANRTVSLSWNASNDASGIAEYQIYLNSQPYVVSSTTSFVTVPMGTGRQFFQLASVDNAGNESPTTSSAIVTVP